MDKEGEYYGLTMVSQIITTLNVHILNPILDVNIIKKMNDHTYTKCPKLLYGTLEKQELKTNNNNAQPNINILWNISLAPTY